MATKKATKKATKTTTKTGAKLAASMATDLRRPVHDATMPFTFKIEEADIEKAECGDPNYCVVAMSLMRAFGDLFEGVEVGSTVVHVITPGRIIRYATPSKLKRQIPVFDRTGKWDLPPGEYTLLVFNKPDNRWDKKRNSGIRPQDVFKARALPTRRLRRVEAMQSCPMPSRKAAA